MRNSEFPSPAIEAIYAEIGQIHQWQLLIDVFKILAREGSINVHEPLHPDPGGKEKISLDAVSKEEPIDVSLEFTKDGDKTSISLIVPGGLFLSDKFPGDTEPTEPVFILEASGLYTIDEISNDASFWAKVAKTFKDLSPKA